MIRSIFSAGLFLSVSLLCFSSAPAAPGNPRGSELSASAPPSAGAHAATREAPETFRGIYLTCWSAGSAKRLSQITDLARTGLINAVVLDIKDASGYVAFKADVPEVERYAAKRIVIRDVGALVDRLHEAGLYVVARIVVFQDPRLALARPELAVHQASRLPEVSGLSPATVWRDRRELAWLDPAAVEVWDYNVKIAEDAISRGFDEINFDYIRFPSDGNLQDMHFPVWDGVTARNLVIANFFAYLRRHLEGSTLSADLFGLATVNSDDLGVGQVIEDAYRYFDYVCPMVYPSHFASGFLGKENPAEHPFQVVSYSMRAARDRLLAMVPETSARARIRPWLQDFSLGTPYDADMVKAQITAVESALGEDYAGYIMWNARNNYTEAALTQSDRQ